VLERSAESLGLPLITAPCTAAEYGTAFETALKKAADLGAEACAFGDMDVDLHLEWNKARCAATGLGCITPLWHIEREKAVSEELALGFIAVIKCVEKKFLGAEFLGKPLTRNW
jgi:diphthamide synthase (EF-2-diphthine--ammonia ligase)